VSRVVGIGSELELAGYALTGVEVETADEPGAAGRAWAELDADVGLVLLTADAAAALPDRGDRPDVLYVVLPR
jgi:hypothetical protein